MDELEQRKVLILSTDEDFFDFKLDLGGISPAIAYAMLRSAKEILETMLPSPRITNFEEVIYDPYEDWIIGDDEE